MATPAQGRMPSQDTSQGAPFEMEKPLAQQLKKTALDMPSIWPNAFDGDMQLMQAWFKAPEFDVNASYLVQTIDDLFTDAFNNYVRALKPHESDAPVPKSGVRKTALTLSIENSHFEMIHALLAMPGIIVSPDQAHDLCMLAAEKGDLHLLRLMLGRPGVDVNKRDAYSSPYLALAARNGHLPIVHALLAVPGIDVNAQGRKGKTALHEAIQNNHRQIAMTSAATPGIDINALSCNSGSFK